MSCLLSCLLPLFMLYLLFIFLSLSASFALPPVSSVSPLNADEFCRELATHPDQQQVAFVLQGIRHGFKLGFQSTHRLRPAKKNKPSAFQHAKVVDEYLANEVSLGRVAGPFNSPPRCPACTLAVLV